MLPYTATDMLYAIKIEYGLDQPAAQAPGKQSADVISPRPRRVPGWVHSLVTVLF